MCFSLTHNNIYAYDLLVRTSSYHFYDTRIYSYNIYIRVYVEIVFKRTHYHIISHLSHKYTEEYNIKY